MIVNYSTCWCYKLPYSLGALFDEYLPSLSMLSLPPLPKLEPSSSIFLSFERSLKGWKWEFHNLKGTLFECHDEKSNFFKPTIESSFQPQADSDFDPRTNLLIVILVVLTCFLLVRRGTLCYQLSSSFSPGLNQFLIHECFPLKTFWNFYKKFSEELLQRTGWQSYLQRLIRLFYL